MSAQDSLSLPLSSSVRCFKKQIKIDFFGGCFFHIRKRGVGLPFWVITRGKKFIKKKLKIPWAFYLT
jgi:hypothetical protein